MADELSSAVFPEGRDCWAKPGWVDRTKAARIESHFVFIRVFSNDFGRADNELGLRLDSDADRIQSRGEVANISLDLKGFPRFDFVDGVF